MDEIKRLTAWNEGNTDVIPHGYEPDSLDWQRDFRYVLKAVENASRIADDFIPDSDADAPLALDEMRRALKTFVA